MPLPSKTRRKKTLKVLFATPEIHPLVKTGGLGDVSGALPPALRHVGVDARVLVPGYSKLMAAVPKKRLLARMSGIPEHGEIRLLSAAMPGSGTPLLIVDYPPYYDRPGGPYLDARGRDWPDNMWRFGLLSRVAALLGSGGGPLAWRPDIVHCNDWQTGLAPALLHFAPGPKAATVITIHNLAYQGIFPPEYVTRLGLPASSFSMEGVEYYGSLSFLKAGLFYADHITTVSPTYAAEIQGEPLGFGLQGLLAARKAHLTGIVNGVDLEHWNPSADPFLPKTYSAHRLAGKQANKLALQRRLGLEGSPDVPLLGMVSRITDQKGVDLVLQIASRIIAEPAQLALLGTGDPALEQACLKLARRHPGRIGLHIGFDEGLSHLVEAGSDIFLMPSRFEPCGLNQMYSMIYGTPPVVHATGGLADTVVDATPATLKDGSATGFVFDRLTPQDFLAAVRRALSAYRDKKTWRGLQRNGMGRDFSWERSALEYRAVYGTLLT